MKVPSCRDIDAKARNAQYKYMKKMIKECDVCTQYHPCEDHMVDYESVGLYVWQESYNKLWMCLYKIIENIEKVGR